MTINTLSAEATTNGKTAVRLELDGAVSMEELLAMLTGGKAVVAEKPKAKAPKPRKAKTTQRQPDYSKCVEVPLNECLGHAFYPTRNGLSMVAIYKTGTNKAGKPWKKLLWVSEDQTTAFHDQGGFYGNAEKIADIEMY